MSANKYPILDRLVRSGIPPEAQLGRVSDQLRVEARSINAKIQLLPTSHEMEAMPELTYLGELALFMNSEEFRPIEQQLIQHEAIFHQIWYDIIWKVVDGFLRTKIFTNKTLIEVGDRLLTRLVEYCPRFLRTPHDLPNRILKTILDKSMEMYKQNGLEQNLMQWGFGEYMSPDQKTMDFVDQLKPGDQIDCLRGSNNQYAWIRATFDSFDGHTTKVRFYGDFNVSFVTDKYKDIRPLGSKSTDHEWRENVNVNDLVDYFNFKTRWVLARVVGVTLEQGSQGETTKMLELRLGNVEGTEGSQGGIQNAADYQSLQFGHTSGPPKIRSHNPCVTRPYTKSNKIASQIDDMDDQTLLSMVDKPKWAMVRPMTHSGSSSIFFVRQMNNFGRCGGFDFIFAALDFLKTQDSIAFSRALDLLKNSAEVLIRPILNEKGPHAIKCMFEFTNQYLEQNIRTVEKMDLTHMIEATTAVANRLYEYNESNKIVLDMVVKVGVICLNSEILDKQVYGSRLMFNYEGELRKTQFRAESKNFCEELLAKDILPKLLNGHHDLISKCAPLYRLLLHENMLAKAHLQVLCQQLEKSHSDSKAALAKLIKEISPTFSREMNVEFLELMNEHIEEATTEIIEVIMLLNRIGYHQHDEDKSKDLSRKLLWKMIQSPKEHGKSVVKELLAKFVESIRGDQLGVYLPILVDGYINTLNKRHLKLLIKLMKSEYMPLGEVCLYLKPELIDACANDLIRKLEALAKLKNPTSMAIVEPEGSQKELPVVAHDQSPEDIAKDIKRSLKFLENFVKSRVEIENRLFTFEHFGRILDTMLRLRFCDSQTMNFLGLFVEQLKAGDSIQKIKQFFESHVQMLDNDSGQDFLPLFTNILKSVNLIENRLVKQQAKVQELYSNIDKLIEFAFCRENADSFFGIRHFWALFRSTPRKDLFTQIGKELIRIYLASEFYSYDQSGLYKIQKQTLIDTAHELLMEGSLLAAQKGSLLLMSLIKKEEMKEPHQPVSMSQLKDGDLMTLRLQRETGLESRNQGFKILIYDNQTLSELRKAVEKSNTYLKSDRIIIKKEDRTKIQNFDHFQTLEFLGVKDGDYLFYENAEVSLADIDILTPNKQQFLPEVIAFWEFIFGKYSTDGLMSPEQFAKFTKKATNGHNCTADETRVKSVFQEYGVSPQALRVDGFLNFYLNCAILDEKGEKIVKQNLFCLEYDKWLIWTRGMSLGEILGSLTRVKLANDPTSFLQLIKLLSEDTVTVTTKLVEYDYVRRLFSMLPPPTRFISEAMINPTAFVATAANTFDFVQKAKVINGLLFRANFIEYSRNIGVPMSEEDLTGFQKRVLNAEFIKTFAVKIRDFLAKTIECTGHPEFSFTISLIAKILKGILGLHNPDFVNSVKKMSNFFVGKQKKGAEKPQTDLQNPFYEPSAKPETEVVNQEDAETDKLKSMITRLKIENELKQTIAFDQLNETFLLVLKSLNRKLNDFSREMRFSMRWAAACLALSAKIQPAQILMFIDSDLFKETMVGGLKHPIMIWRNNFTNLYGLLAEDFDDAKTKTHFLKTLISNIRSEGGDEFNNLVELACSILADVGELKAKNAEFAEFIHREFNFLTLFSEFEQKLLSHPSTEKLFSDRTDQLLMSYLAFLENILNADDSVLEQLSFQTKEKLVHFIFHDCLFQIFNGQVDFSNVKCHSKRSRSLAFALLRRLLKNNNRLNIHFMVKEISPLARHIPPMFVGQAVQSDSDRKMGSGYLGVRNLGCICYMIAILQQFYCTPAFRYGILMGTDYVAPKLTDVKGTQIDDNFFHQFQKIMAYLDSSERKDFTPGEFCFSYKDYSGNPTNVSQQQDADEFLKIMADKIENALKKSPFVGVLNSVFMGKQCNIIQCKSCGHENIGEEDFFNLSLEVKGMDNLIESFERYIKAESISDYMCDRCKVKREISKKAMLKSLPNVLIISLKKMFFDLEILANTKLHTHYEFPMELNLRKFMYQQKTEAPKPEAREEGMEIEQDAPSAAQPQAQPLTDKDCEYKLVGVVIHQGNAEYGHYTSLINANRGDPRRPEITTDKWYEFNDSRVTWFDMRKFQEECFGPAAEKGYSAYTPEPQTSKSAYMLVYEKVKKNDLVIKFTEDQKAEKELLLSNLIDRNDVRVNGEELCTGFYNLNAYVPEPHKSDIWRDNCLLNAEQNLLSADFTTTLATIFSDVNFGTDPRNAKEDRVYAETVLKNLPILVSKIYCVASEGNKMADIVNTIKKAFSVLSSSRGESPSEREMVDQKILNFYKEQIFANYSNFIKAITGLSDQNVAFGLIDYMSGIIGLTIKHFGIRAIEFGQKEEGSTETKAKNAVFQTIYQLFVELTQVDYSSGSIRKAQKLFQLARRFTNESPIIAHFFITGNLLGHLIDLYLKVDCSNKNPAEKSLAQLLQLVNDLYMFARQQSASHPNFNAIADKVNKVDTLCKAIREDYKFEEFESLKRLTYTFLYGDQLASELTIYSVLSVLPYSPDYEILGPMEFFKACFHVDDHLKYYRAMLVLGQPRLLEGNTWERDPLKNMFYGLARDNSYSLKKPYIQYVSPFGGEKGLLDLIASNPTQYENNTMVMMNYLLDFMLNFPVALNCVLFAPPHNYISASFYDWFSVFCDHNLKGDIATSASYRSIMFNRKLNELPEKLGALEKLIQSLKGASVPSLEGKKIFTTGPNPYVTYDFPSAAQKEANSDKELWSMRPNYIIGKTLGYRNLANIVLQSNSRGETLELNVTLIRVALLPSFPTGHSNKSIPEGLMCSDYSISMYSTNSKEISDFIGSNRLYFADNSDDKMELEPIFNDSEDPLSVKPRPITKSKPQPQGYVKLAEPGNDYSSDFLLRVAFSNSTPTTFFIKTAIQGPPHVNNTFDNFVTMVKGDKRDQLVQILTLSKIDQTFEGVKVSVSVKATNSASYRFYSEDFPQEPLEVFSFTQG